MRKTALLLVVFAATALAQEAKHPREIASPELRFEPPSPLAFRTKLENGLTAYLVPDDSLPCVRIRAYVRTGTIFDPEDKEGLCGLAFAALKAAGAGDLEPAALEKKLDALGATIDTDASETRGVVDAWTLSAHADEVMRIFADVLRRPRFDEERVTRIRDDSASEAKNDEDDSSVLATRRLRVQIYGLSHPYARFRSADSLGELDAKDLKAFHKAAFLPGRVILAVSGRFEPAAMKKAIEELFGDWKGGKTGWPAEVPAVTKKARSGITIVDRPDMTASYIELGHLGVVSGSPEEAALTLTDHIWGSGSFTSRVVSRVRTDEGLAYTCGSDYDTPPLVPGLARTYMQCGANEASYALKLSLEEAKRLAEDGPTAEELENAKEAAIGRFPGRFTTATDRARSFAEADLDGLPDDVFAKYRERIAAVTAADVKAAAAQFFGPNGVSVVIVGPASAVRRSLTHGTSLDDLGPVRLDKTP